jgi:hypothetical protein
MIFTITTYYSGDKIKQMRWARHIASMRTGDVLTEFWCGGGGGRLRERDHLEDLGVDGRIKSTWIFN